MVNNSVSLEENYRDMITKSPGIKLDLKESWLLNTIKADEKAIKIMENRNTASQLNSSEGQEELMEEEGQCHQGF